MQNCHLIARILFNNQNEFFYLQCTLIIILSRLIPFFYEEWGAWGWQMLKGALGKSLYWRVVHACSHVLGMILEAVWERMVVENLAIQINQ